MKMKIEVEKLPILAKRCVQMCQRISLGLILNRNPDQQEPLIKDLEELWNDLVSAQFMKGDVNKLLKEKGIGVLIEHLKKAAHVIVLNEWEAGRWYPDAKFELEFPMMDSSRLHGVS